MLADKTMAYGIRILSIHSSDAHQAYSKTPELLKYAFWQSFDKMDSTIAHKIWQLLKARCPQSGSAYHFTAALHTTMRTMTSLAYLSFRTLVITVLM